MPEAISYTGAVEVGFFVRLYGHSVASRDGTFHLPEGDGYGFATYEEAEAAGVSAVANGQCNRFSIEKTYRQSVKGLSHAS